MNVAINYRHLSHDGAANALAHNEGLAERREDARETFCESHLANELAAFARKPLGDHRKDEMSLWQLFSERQADKDDPLNMSLSRMLVAMATMPPQVIEYLRTTNSALADAAILVQQDIETMFGEEAAGLFDTADRTGSWEGL